MDKRENISSGSHWETNFGYSRLVKVGNHIEIAGTVAANSDVKVVGLGDCGEQTRYVLQKIIPYLEKAGGKAENIVRIWIFTTDITQWEKIGKAHGEIFGNIKPAMSLIGVNAFVATEFLIEIEATAIL